MFATLKTATPAAPLPARWQAVPRPRQPTPAAEGVSSPLWPDFEGDAQLPGGAFWRESEGHRGKGGTPWYHRPGHDHAALLRQVPCRGSSRCSGQPDAVGVVVFDVDLVSCQRHCCLQAGSFWLCTEMPPGLGPRCPAAPGSAACRDAPACTDLDPVSSRSAVDRAWCGCRYGHRRQRSDHMPT